MQNVPGRRATRALLLCSLALITACDAPEPTEVSSGPLLDETTGTPHLEASSAPALIECPVANVRTAIGRVPHFGGAVALDGNAVSLPFGAVAAMTDIAIHVHASRHVRVDLTANGQQHWQFMEPVSVTIDYSRCPDSSLVDGPLSVWYIDSATGEMLQNMGGIDDREQRRIRFTTDHFSGYAIAN